MRRIRWEHINDSAALAYDTPPPPKRPKPVAWISVTDPDDLHRCMVAIERALDYGKVPPEVRAALDAEREIEIEGGE